MTTRQTRSGEAAHLPVTIGALELRRRFGYYRDRARRGEIFIVTVGGKTVAEFGPIRAPDETPTKREAKTP